MFIKNKQLSKSQLEIIAIELKRRLGYYPDLSYFKDQKYRNTSKAVTKIIKTYGNKILTPDYEKMFEDSYNLEGFEENGILNLIDNVVALVDTRYSTAPEFIKSSIRFYFENKLSEVIVKQRIGENNVDNFKSYVLEKDPIVFEDFIFYEGIKYLDDYTASTIYLN